jgi:hypothetical protein
MQTFWATVGLMSGSVGLLFSLIRMRCSPHYGVDSPGPARIRWRYAVRDPYYWLAFVVGLLLPVVVWVNSTSSC